MALSASGKVSGKLESCGLQIVRANGSSNQTTLTTWDDMIACNMPIAEVRDAYKKDFGENPDQVHLNDDFCKQYGWLSYNIVGEITIRYDSTPTRKSQISAERMLENTTSQLYTTDIELSTTMANSATTTVTNASSVSVGSSITIGSKALGIGAEFSQDFTFSNEVGSSSTQSTEVSVSDKVTVTVPPGAKLRVFLEVTWIEENKEWVMPVMIDPYGKTGAKFKRKVQGHYHWGMYHCDFFKPPFQSDIRKAGVCLQHQRTHRCWWHPTKS